MVNKSGPIKLQELNEENNYIGHWQHNLFKNVILKIKIIYYKKWIKEMAINTDKFNSYEKHYDYQPMF